MTGQTPVVQGDGRWSDKVRRLHARPLRVEQDLKSVRSSGELDSQDPNTRVLLITKLRDRLEALTIGIDNVKGGAGGRVEQDDLHLFIVQLEVGSGSVEGDGGIGVHAPVDVLRGGDFVLDEDLTAVIEHAATTLDGVAGPQSQYRIHPNESEN